MPRCDHTRPRRHLLTGTAMFLVAGGAVAIPSLDMDHQAAALQPVAVRTDPPILESSNREEPAADVPAASVTPTTVAPPSPAPTTVPPAAPAPAAPAPALPQVSTPAPPPVDPMARIEAAYKASVPAGWRSAIDVRFKLVSGSTSRGWSDGTIEIGSYHREHGDAVLRATIAHEFGHLIAFRYGSQAFFGAAPEGWPAYSARPEEAWADCVSRAFTAIDDPSHGLPSCGGQSLSWTASWVRSRPDAHVQTAG